MQHIDREVLQARNVSMLLFKRVGGEGKDFDETHGDVQARVSAIRARRLHHGRKSLSPRLRHEYKENEQVDDKGGRHGEASNIVV